MPVQGTWGIGNYKLPDYGFTELLRELAGRTPSAERTTTFNNPAVYQSKNISTAPANYGVNDITSTFRDPAAPTGGGTSGGTSGGGTPSGGGSGVDEVGLADLARRNRINSYKAQAGGIRDTAQGTFDNILKAVNAFRERSGTLRDNAGQEIVNRSSDILGENARSSRDLEGTTRAKGRALGLGDSSKFINQNKLAANLAATQGNTIARRGEEDRANSALYQERQDQAQTQENEAGTYLKSARDRASQVENMGYDAGEEQFANSLNDIVNYQRSLASINPMNAGGLTQYAPDFGGIVNTINDVISGGAAPSGGVAGAPTEENFVNPVNPQDIFSLLKRRGLVQG